MEKVKKRTEQIIRERKKGYLDYQLKKASEKGGMGNRFAALAKLFMSVDKVPNFDVKTLCSNGASNFQAAEECADYFSAISDEFQPLDLSTLPTTYSVQLPLSSGLTLSSNFGASKSRGQWFQGIFSPN